MQFSYSRVGTFEKCKYQFKLHYLEGLETVFNCDPANALINGLALHKGMETNVETAIEEFLNSYPVVTDELINESIKIRHWIPIVKSIIPEGIHELKVETKDFLGFIDLLVKNGDGTYDLYDYKYSNNIDNYMKSGQLHIYKDYVEEVYKIKIRKLFFVFIPKTRIKQKKTETLYQFRKRLIDELNKMEVQVKEVKYDANKKIEFLETIQKIKSCKNFDEKNETNLCDWCEFKALCKEGNDYMILPKNERKEATINTTPDMWLYGDSYSGKTVFMDSFDDTLMINTDGNVDHITSPVIRIKDEITMDGRLTKKKFAWVTFKEAIAELEKKDNDFKTVVVDLVEDMYEHCRLYMYNKEGWEHESDGAFGKGWDMIMTEFLSTMKRLKNTGYQIVYLSKQVTNTITYKSGQEVTTFKPNIKDKIANVLAGTVDLTARIVVEENGEHYMSFKNSETIFGGSRYDFGVEKITLSHDSFIETMINAQKGRKVAPKRVEKTPVISESSSLETEEETKKTADKSVPEDGEKPKRHKRGEE